MATGMKVFPGYKFQIGRAYVALPSDLSRADYIKDCYLNWQISIITEDGSFYNRVPISPEVLSFVTFPTTAKTLGSPLIYVTDDEYQQPVVVNRLAQRTELGDSVENQFKFRRMLGDQLVEINGNPATGSINVLVDGATITGQLNINIFNQDQDCELNIDVAGDINATASGDVNINAGDGISVTTTDADSGDSASFQQTSTENKFYNKSFTINDGQDPLTLANELVTFLGNFIDTVAQITVLAQGTPSSPPINASQLEALKQQLDTLKSKTAFVDK